MTEVLVPIAVKFIEGGGLYALLGIYMLTLLGGAYIIGKMFGRFDTCQEARIVDTRELAEKVIIALGEAKNTIDAATRAAEMNARLSEANRNTIDGFREAMNAMMRTFIARGGRK